MDGTHLLYDIELKNTVGKPEVSIGVELSIYAEKALTRVLLFLAEPYFRCHLNSFINQIAQANQI